MAKVNGSSFSPGDQILFLRGGVWSEQLVPTSSGTSSAPIIFGAYGSGSRPVINAGGALPGWNSTGNWTDLGGNVWSCNYGRYPAAVWLNGQLYGTSGNNSGAGSSTPNARYRWWHDGNSTFKVYSEGNPATTYNQIEIANLGRNTLVASGKSYLIFRSLEFRRGQRGADLSNCDFFTFDSCAFLGTPQFSLWIQDGSDDGEIKNCTFDTGDTVSHSFEFTGDAGTGNGGDIIAIQWGNRWKIHGNTIANPGHDCINLSGGDPSGSVSQDNQIYCNEMYMNGGDYGRPFDIQGFSTPGTCSNNRVTRNYIHGFPIQAQVLGQSNELSYNIFADGKLCPWRTDNNWYASSAISLCDYIGNGENSNKVWNNTVINCQSAGIVVYPGQSRASVKNNIVYNTGLAAGRFTQNVGICIWQGTTYDTVFNNAIYNSGANPVVYEQQLWTTNTPISVSSFNTMSGGSYGNVIAGNIGSNPLLASDNTLQSSSPCIKAGVNVGLTVDYAGVPVTSPPDVGARQSGTAPPPPPPPATGPVTYYVRNDGNDGNTGTSDAAAWASVARVNQATLNPGDRVLFKSGGLWAEQLSPALSGTSTQPILYGAYGSGARPVIDASGPLPGWNSTGAWISVGANVWQFNGTRSPGRLWLSGVEYGASGDAAGNGVSTPTSRYRWWSDGVKLLVYSPGGNPATAYSSITAASVGRLAMSLGGQSYLVFRGLDFRGGETCIELRNADFVTFDSCSILRGTSRYGLVARDGSNNGVVSNCQLDRADSVAHAFVYGGDETGGNGQDNLLLLGASHWDIGRNTIADFGHVGVMLSGNRASGLYTTDN
ncbi:MAG TPA: right-handed parallel beta-helix repeat-containing protein, partial [Bacteroidota bacterium]